MSEHQWGNRDGIKWPLCLRCGVIQRRDGKNSAECRGPAKMRPFAPAVAQATEARPEGELRAIERWTHDMRYWGNGEDECLVMRRTASAGEFVRYDDVEELLNQRATPPLDAQALAEEIARENPLMFSSHRPVAHIIADIRRIIERAGRRE